MAIVYLFRGESKEFDKQVQEGTSELPLECPTYKGHLVKHGRECSYRRTKDPKGNPTAPVIGPAVALDPSLPVSTQVTLGPVSAPREQVKAMLVWTGMWEELT